MVYRYNAYQISTSLSRYNWNVVESGVKHLSPNPLYYTEYDGFDSFLLWNIYLNRGGQQFHQYEQPVNDDWISNGNKRFKSCIDSIPRKKTSYYHKNEWQHKHGYYNSRVDECS